MGPFQAEHFSNYRISTKLELMISTLEELPSLRWAVFPYKPLKRLTKRSWNTSILTQRRVLDISHITSLSAGIHVINHKRNYKRIN